MLRHLLQTHLTGLQQTGCPGLKYGYPPLMLNSYMSKHSPSIHSSSSHILMSLLNPLSSILVSFSFLSISLARLHVKDVFWHESHPDFYFSWSLFQYLTDDKKYCTHSPAHPPSILWHGYFCTGRYTSLVATSTFSSYITCCHTAPGIFVKNAACHWTTVAVEWGALSPPSVFKDNYITIVLPDNNGMIGSSWATNLTPNSICSRIETVLFI